MRAEKLSGSRTIQTPKASFHRVSTSPTLHSLGTPALTACGGSNSTWGNRSGVVAARLEVQAAEKATQPTVVHLRRPRRETPSAGTAAGAAGLTAGAAAAGAAGAGAAATAGLG